MNKLVSSTLAMTAIGGIASATSGTDSQWSGLDSQLETIRSSYTADSQDLLASVGGLVSSSFLFADADIANNVGGNGNAAEDDLGFTLDNALLWAEGQVGDRFNWRISTDGSGGGLVLEEAFGDWNFDNGTLRMGHFMPTVARFQGYAREEMLFARMPIFAAGGLPLADGPGVSYLGSGGAIDYAVTVYNGFDGTTDDEFGFAGRAQWNMNGGVGGNEGAFGAADGLVGTIGLFVDSRGDAGAVSGGTTFGVDAAFTGGNWSAGATIVSNDDDSGDNTPIMLQGSYMVSEDGEIALRYEDNDDVPAVDTSRITVGYNWYQHGTNGFWQVNAGSDEIGGADGTFFSVSWVLGDSGNFADAGSGQR